MPPSPSAALNIPAGTVRQAASRPPSEVQAGVRYMANQTNQTNRDMNKGTGNNSRGGSESGGSKPGKPNAYPPVKAKEPTSEEEEEEMPESEETGIQAERDQKKTPGFGKRPERPSSERERPSGGNTSRGGFGSGTAKQGQVYETDKEQDE